MKKLLLGATVVGSALALAGGAYAGPISWDIAPGNIDTSLFAASETVTATPLSSPAQTIIVTGYGPSGMVIEWNKHQGVGEIGLGLENDPSGQHEVTLGSFLQIDVSGLTSPPLTGLSLSAMNSSTSGGEKYTYYLTNTVGTLAGALAYASGTTNGTTKVNFGSYKYIDFAETGTGPGNNILLDEFITATVADVPEPASFAVLGVGLVGLGFVRKIQASLTR